MTILTEGDAAPYFDLETADGRVRLSDFASKALVLYFYPKDDTSGCTREAIDFTALADEFAKAGAAIVGVSKDSPASHKKFIAKHNLSIVLASDPPGDMIERYGVWVEKSLYGRKYMGIERATFLIRGGKIARSWRKVKVAGHAEQVLQAARTD